MDGNRVLWWEDEDAPPCGDPLLWEGEGRWLPAAVLMWLIGGKEGCDVRRCAGCEAATAPFPVPSVLHDAISVATEFMVRRGEAAQCLN
jgi:hypothetical protein